MFSFVQKSTNRKKLGLSSNHNVAIRRYDHFFKDIECENLCTAILSRSINFFRPENEEITFFQNFLSNQPSLGNYYVKTIILHSILCIFFNTTYIFCCWHEKYYGYVADVSSNLTNK